MGAEAAAEGKKAAVLTTRDQADKYSSENIILLGEGASGEEVAKHLYSALRECDDIGAELIYSESFNRDELGGAIMNRLLKAAGQKLIYV